MNPKSIAIIGSGFGGLAAAIYLARQGHHVSVYEKNEQVGGRASVREQDGFRFDMGPSRYLMPDIFQYFFAAIDEQVEDYLSLTKLSPSYTVHFTGTHSRQVSIYDDIERNRSTFESLEPGSTDQMHKYIAKAQYQYEVAVKEFIPKNYDSILDFFTRRTLIQGTRLHIFSTMQHYTSKFFKSTQMQKIAQYPLVFLGAAPKSAPALYNIMSYVDFGLGVRYPQGGISQVIATLVKIAQKHGVRFYTNSEVSKIKVQDKQVKGIELITGEQYDFDVVISNADMHWTETKLLDPIYQSYPETYRSKKVIAPSAFILYLGIEGKVANLQHHNLIFCEDRDKNFEEIFQHKTPPTDPSLYICCPSKTDPSVAPPGDENMFILVPFPPGISLSTQEQLDYRNKIMKLVEDTIGQKFQNRIKVERIFTNQDFTSRYNAYQGTALGLAHTLGQTAIFRPNNISKKVKNLYYTGAYTNPGIGMPMCLISGLLVAQRLSHKG